MTLSSPLLAMVRAHCTFKAGELLIGCFNAWRICSIHTRTGAFARTTELMDKVNTCVISLDCLYRNYSCVMVCKRSVRRDYIPYGNRPILKSSFENTKILVHLVSSSI